MLVKEGSVLEFIENKKDYYDYLGITPKKLMLLVKEITTLSYTFNNKPVYLVEFYDIINKREKIFIEIQYFKINKKHTYKLGVEPIAGDESVYKVLVGNLKIIS